MLLKKARKEGTKYCNVGWNIATIGTWEQTIKHIERCEQCNKANKEQLIKQQKDENK